MSFAFLDVFSCQFAKEILRDHLVELAPLAQRKGASKGKGSPGASASSPYAGGKPAARVVRVLDRAHDTVIGRYEVAEPFGVVVPEDARIPYDVFTMRAESPHVPDGALVRVRIAQFPTRHTAATGVVEEVIGMAEDADMGIDLIVARHKLETSFSQGALDEAAAATLDVPGALAEGYRDIRERFVFTIDPTDARDFDDALSLELVDPVAFTWRLGVHIADVSHYVPWNSSVDLDARRRATSVYLADRVIPMLPHELCDELCSLKPGEDRRSLTVDLFLSDDGKLLDFDMYPALIRSKVRLSYDEALEILQGGEVVGAVSVGGAADAADGLAQMPALGAAGGTSAPADARTATLKPLLDQCSALAKARAAQREKAGGLDFSTTEAKVALDDEGRPIDVVLRTKNDATELVEEAMILANETVAAHLASCKWPCVYRVHESPAPDALAGLVPVFQEFPWFTEDDALRLMMGDAHTMQKILGLSAPRAEGELVSSLLLRSMKRAVYRPENDGHFGLASSAYCHFTSPIRRYPDLVVHRMLRAQLTRRPERFDQEVSALKWISEHSSDMERIADAAARESQELKIIEYLTQFVGTSFSGIVSGVANYGLYVRLECTAEGMLPMRALGDEYFSFDPARYQLTGQDSGKVYRLGQRVAVTLKAAEPRSGKLEFTLATGREVAPGCR